MKFIEFLKEATAKGKTPAEKKKEAQEDLLKAEEIAHSMQANIGPRPEPVTLKLTTD